MPYRKPSSLFQICVKNTIQLINKISYFVEKNYPDFESFERQQHIHFVNRYLVSTLPRGLFDVLCMSRECCPYQGNRQLPLYILLHPQMLVFRRTDIDNCMPQNFCIRMIKILNNLVVLDLRFICTDEILKAISVSCPLLEELNIVSKVEVRKSSINASVLVRNVSDIGLSYIATLKRIRILAMDPPRNEKSNRVVCGVTQTGVVLLVIALPLLELLHIESCDIGSTLISSELEIVPLKLKKINCHYTSPEKIQQLVKICPNLKELVITCLSNQDKDAILDEISMSNLKLDRLDVFFFSYSLSLANLLQIHGQYLTHFSLWETDDCMTIESLITLGLSCPNITYLCLLTQSFRLSVLSTNEKPNIFSKLQTLTIGRDNFNMEKILIFFFECTQNLEKLSVKYQTKSDFDETLKHLLLNGYLNNIKTLWLDCTYVVSKDVVLQVIQKCSKLVRLTVDCSDMDMFEIHEYISNNNLDLKIGVY